MMIVSFPYVELCNCTRYLLWFCTRTVVFAHAPFVVNHIYKYDCVSKSQSVSLSCMYTAIEVKCCNNFVLAQYRIGELGHTLPVITL